ncbi:SSI family serine proteinase inhibitor [Streptomyces sp. NPDC059534]|uniref:SSI family serine proteinase inhibitor n=1 Tax=Streptomyces sp. NPDC059534 TaxID=3346859 RepID=UPI0036C0B7F1
MKKLVLALGAVLLVASPAVAATAPVPTPSTGTHIQLTVTRATDGVESTSSVWLDCPSRRGTGHPHRESACADVSAADGDFDRLPGRTTAICSNDSRTTTVTAHGTHGLREVDWERTFTNDCALTLATGKLFDF